METKEKIDFEKELDQNNRLTIVRYGLVIILLTFSAMIAALWILRIDDQSLLQLIIEYLSNVLL